MIPSSESSKVSQLPSENWLHLQDDYWRRWQASAGSFRSCKKSMCRSVKRQERRTLVKTKKLLISSSGDARKSPREMFSLWFHKLKHGWCFYSGHLKETEDEEEHWASSFPQNGKRNIHFLPKWKHILLEFQILPIFPFFRWQWTVLPFHYKSHTKFCRSPEKELPI